MVGSLYSSRKQTDGVRTGKRERGCIAAPNAPEHHAGVPSVSTPTPDAVGAPRRGDRLVGKRPVRRHERAEDTEANEDRKDPKDHHPEDPELERAHDVAVLSECVSKADTLGHGGPSASWTRPTPPHQSVGKGPRTRQPGDRFVDINEGFSGKAASGALWLAPPHGAQEIGELGEAERPRREAEGACAGGDRTEDFDGEQPPPRRSAEGRLEARARAERRDPTYRGGRKNLGKMPEKPRDPGSGNRRRRIPRIQQLRIAVIVVAAAIPETPTISPSRRRHPRRTPPNSRTPRSESWCCRRRRRCARGAAPRSGTGSRGRTSRKRARSAGTPHRRTFRSRRGTVTIGRARTSSPAAAGAPRNVASPRPRSSSERTSA